jgi:hypothetical protein
MTEDIYCYSQRMLNPYRGIFCCIRYLSAEAVTADGVNWDIYVSNDALREGLADDVVIQTSDIRYGKWSPHHGLRRGPMYPSDDFRRMEDMGHVVFRHLTKVYRQVPFRFADSIEHWLLDQSGEPLALLESVLEQTDIMPATVSQWQCGMHCLDEFQSEALTGHYAGSVSAGQWLMRMVAELAGDKVNTIWVARRADGSGACLHTNESIDAERFPVLPLRHDAMGGLMGEVMREYMQWQAPWLLQLDHLSEDLRRQLEVSAAKQAMAMDKLHRLYPYMLDEGVLSAARVEAAMRRSLQDEPEESPPDNRQATYYIEPDKRPFQ